MALNAFYSLQAARLGFSPNFPDPVDIDPPPLLGNVRPTPDPVADMALMYLKVESLDTPLEVPFDEDPLPFALAADENTSIPPTTPLEAPAPLLAPDACKPLKVLRLTETTPFERGKELGQKQKDEIHTVYTQILSKVRQDPSFASQKAALHLEDQIPPDILEEMRGLSEGAEVPLEDVIDIHIFLDVFAGSYGCSVLGYVQNETDNVKVAATNHFAQDPNKSRESEMRAFDLLQTPFDGSFPACEAALNAVAKPDTIQKIFFHPTEGSLDVSVYSSSSGSMTPFQNVQVWEPPHQAESDAHLVRCLDWPWSNLGDATVLVVSPSNEGSFVNVTFPGYLGALSAMNDRGVALSVSQSGSSHQEGVPVTLLFRQVIKTARTAEEAIAMIDRSVPSSSMNLTVVGKDGVARVEIDPVRKPNGGYADLEHRRLSVSTISMDQH